MTDDHETVKNVLDGAAAVVGLGTLFKWLPAIAALFTIIWTGLRIFDWIEKRFKKNEG